MHATVAVSGILPSHHAAWVDLTPGRLLRWIRLDPHLPELTRKAMAETLGVSPATIGRIEKGGPLTPAMIERLLDVYPDYAQLIVQHVLVEAVKTLGLLEPLQKSACSDANRDVLLALAIELDEFCEHLWRELPPSWSQDRGRGEAP